MCATFGLHRSLQSLRDIYSSGEAAFVANADNYREVTRTQLFAHNEMQIVTKRMDPFRDAPGTGVLGCLTDALTSLEFRTGAVSIEENWPPP